MFSFNFSLKLFFYKQKNIGLTFTFIWAENQDIESANIFKTFGLNGLEP